MSRVFELLAFSSLCLVGICTAAADGALPTDSANRSTDEYSVSERNHWSFVKRSKPVAPMFSDESDRNWIRSPIDSFVLRQLKVIGLRPAPPADRRTLIRRISFDLTGLPPTARAVRQFVHDESPGAYENLVDELLTRPEYGERWGQHWLDVVRFAETEGFEYDRHHADAWRFRDYVIDAFNADKPYNRFITEQLAGDEMKFSAADETGRRTAQIAAGFHRLGPIRRNAGNPEVAFSRNEVLTEMTNIVGTTFLGLTLGCARCHDHMYDPIRQKEYYQLQAFMAATHDADIPLADEPARNRWQEKTKQVEQELERLNAAIEAADEQDRDRLNQELKQLRTQLPAQLPTLFSVKNDFAGQTVIHLLEAGDEFKKGVPVGMRTLGIVSRVDESVYPSDVSRPRSGLADWITAPAHPLPARVMVNRIWHYHFGRGIVSTVNDFGFNGAEPSHPELLDFLAERFVSEGWSVKSIHRLILMSSTYQQSSIHPAEHHAKTIDAQNRLLWRFRRRRLEAEEIRDAMLAVSNRLNRQIGGPGIMVPVEQEMIDLLYKPTQWQVTEDSSQHDRRSIYLVAKRNLRLPFLEVFDQPDLQTSCGTRVASTHAPQALEMLNGKLSNELSAAFAERLRIEAGDNIADRIQLAFLITTGCPPTEQQEAVAAKFLKTEPLEEFALAMFSLNGFLYVD